MACWVVWSFGVSALVIAIGTKGSKISFFFTKCSFSNILGYNLAEIKYCSEILAFVFSFLGFGCDQDCVYFFSH